jgi:hypothetical protein
MNRSSGYGVEPTICTRRDARSITNTVSYVTKPLPRPHLRREEIGPGDRAPVRAQKRAPRRRPLRRRRHALRLQDPGDRRSPNAAGKLSRSRTQSGRVYCRGVRQGTLVVAPAIAQNFRVHPIGARFSGCADVPCDQWQSNPCAPTGLAGPRSPCEPVPARQACSDSRSPYADGCTQGDHPTVSRMGTERCEGCRTSTVG